MTSGKYICAYNGVYLFQVNLFFWNGGRPLCWIRKNEIDQVEAFTDQSNQHDKYTGSVASVILHLSRNDTVDVGSCSSHNGGIIDDKSTFTGVLLYAD